MSLFRQDEFNGIQNVIQNIIVEGQVIFMKTVIVSIRR